MKRSLITALILCSISKYWQDFSLNLITSSIKTYLLIIICIKRYCLPSYNKSLLFVSGWISVSGSESHTETVEGRPGGEVTLTCSNPSIRDALTFWLRVVNRTKASWISTMISSTGTPLYSDVNQNGRFNMSTNISTLFLQIKHVDVSDSGLYFCGFYIGGPFNFSAIHFIVNGKIIKILCSLFCYIC